MIHPVHPPGFDVPHQALSYPSRLMGHELVHEAMGDRTVRRFTQMYMDACTASVPEVPGIDLAEYKQTLIERCESRLPSHTDTPHHHHHHHHHHPPPPPPWRRAAS